MVLNEPPSGLNISLQILKDVNKCMICQKNKNNKGNGKLTSTEKGRGSITNCSSCLKNYLLEGIVWTKENYRVNTCYPRCVRSSERFEKKIEITQIEDLNDELGPSTSFTENRPKWRRVSDSNFTLPSEKLCIIWNLIKSKGDTQILRISEARRASLFLSAITLTRMKSLIGAYCLEVLKMLLQLILCIIRTVCQIIWEMLNVK